MNVVFTDGRRCVLLLTEDLNLTNKAVVMGIKCFSTKVTEIYFIASTHLCAFFLFLREVFFKLFFFFFSSEK